MIRSAMMCVKFWYDGEKYEDRRISSYSSEMYIGEEITLLYNPAYPNRLDVKGTKVLAVWNFMWDGELFSCL